VPSPLAFLRALRNDPTGLLLTAQRTYGDVCEYRMARRLCFVFHPEGVQHVLKENARNYDKRTIGYQKLKLALGDGLLTSEGDFWLKQRRIIQPAFHRDRLRHFGEVMTGSAEEMLIRWRESARAGRPLDVAAEMMRLTLEIIGLTMFSIKLTEDADELGHMTTVALEYINQRMTSWTAAFDFPEKLPTPNNRRFRAAQQRGDELVLAIIEARRRGGAVHRDLLSMLMEVRDADTGEGMSDRQLRDEVLTVFAAGHETTANALAWTWALLSRHPDVGRRLRAELDETLGGRTPTTDDLPRLEYTSMVVKEAMRLYPPAWVVSRNALADDVIGGYRVRAGTVVVVSPFVTHRHASYWDNPEGFDPERFRAEREIPRYAYFPFGGGPRFCVGNNFATMEMQLVLATIAQRFEVQLVPGFPVEMDPLVTLRPRHGVHARLRERTTQRT
jgi:cytochrome P450